eukprot:4358339-Pleurochrysis_carterae.AAC.7
MWNLDCSMLRIGLCCPSEISGRISQISHISPPYPDSENHTAQIRPDGGPCNALNETRYHTPAPSIRASHLTEGVI